ncbi:hypothetical protein M404DRAFT_35282 [Pisolithus tinctorius Marx 270]|uniref:DNA helicase n=1 Tax=Pisolithus tinctorius Marx 270 TaxID=870435 RepID=A0A0C3NFE0_PISTI|nr:hypothetical protein M404DRAFT_35282 [Pisolithus tinctorius Marx 270]
MRCNNDLKINTNGADTKDVAFYITAYAAKKQKKSHNLSALMASALPYHINNPKYDDVCERNHLLIYCCINMINHEAELSGPQVVSYLMGYGDAFTSHNYVALYTGLLFSTIKELYPEFLMASTDRYSYPSTGHDNICTNGDDNNDVIMLLCSRQGELYTCTQMQDYLQRGAELDDLSLLAFGRPAHKHSPYHDDHPKAQSHHRVCRAKGHNTLPQIVGPWLPHHDDSSTYDFYCACMLALLKPWRIGASLKSSDEGWSEAFEHLEASNTPWETHVLAGLQYYYDSKTARKTASIPGKTQQHHSPVGDRQLADIVDDSFEDRSETKDWTASLSETDLATFKRDQLSAQEQAHAKQAIAIALQYGVFTASGVMQRSMNYSCQVAMGEDVPQLEHWMVAMRAMLDCVPGSMMEMSEQAEQDMDHGNVVDNDGMTGPQVGSAYMLAQLATMELSLKPNNIEDLLDDQQQAYNIIDWHLQQFVMGRCLDQLHMTIPREGSVGKLRTIQTITENFAHRGIQGMLVKVAYTGIAASVIDGKTLHNICMILLNGGKQSAQMMKRLEEYWQDKSYLIIDEMSMVS